ncbi:TonB-dependent receptor [Granulicella rosea]|nr:TonB-dependent receptor [Granulicella rosea]
MPKLPSGHAKIAAHATTGSLHGTVRREDGFSALGMQVSIRNADGVVHEVLTAGKDGEFSDSSLKPGVYEVAASSSGAPQLNAVQVAVVAGHDAVASVLVQSSTPAAPEPAAAPKLDNGFMHRLGRAYVADWAGNGPGTETKEARRGYPAPLASPPYPASDWPIGGTPTIGVPDGQTYPLMEALNKNKSRSKIYGWLEVGANGSSNNKTNAGKGIASNFPSAYDEYANTVQLDQAALYFEKLPNTAQTDHVEIGYRLTLLYGVDYRFTTAKGMLSQQLLLKNNQYGFDPVMDYVDIYVPHVGKGMDIRIGRYISLPDIEAQLAPNNYTYSHSILYTFDCYTQTGMNVTVKASDHWTVQAGISPGCDVMPWTTDAKLTGNFCATYTWSHGGDAVNTCANSINDGKYAYNNLSAFYETYYHRFSATWHTDTEFWYQYMREVPNMYWFNGTDPNTGIQYAPTAAHPWPEATFQRPGQGAVNLNFGAVCTDPRKPANLQPSRCLAPEYALVNYVEHNFWHNTASLNIRNEFMNDMKGQRTGTPAVFEEHMVGFDFWAGSTITFRPEVSYTHAFTRYGVSGLNIAPGASISNLETLAQEAATGQALTPNPLGLGKNQAITLSADLIWHF